MRSRLAVWSWILAIISIIIYPGIYFLMILINPGRFGYRGNIFTDIVAPFTLYSMISAALIGLIFGIVAIIKISKNSNLTGKTHAISGIILNILLFLYGIFALVGGIFGS
ncbi:hypothetical protein HYV50_05190 [Candidatus Pacearchaeota archaeon]|nr:hypothetical protein [Candidatus Pacearchaeota archaeon]